MLSNFKVDSSGGDGSLNPNSKYTDWQWILVRDEENSKWTLKTWGYYFIKLRRKNENKKGI